MNSSIANAFRLLNLSDQASPKEVKSAYRQLAKKYHPDRNEHDDQQLFIEITDAYQLLLEYFENPEKFQTENLEKSRQEKRKEKTEENINRAKVYTANKQRAEQEAIERSFQYLEKNWVKTIYYSIVAICVCFSILLLIDYKSTENVRSIQITSISDAIGGTSNEKNVQITTQEDETFDVSYLMLFNMSSDFRLYDKVGMVYESQYLKIPKRIMLIDPGQGVNFYQVDNTVFSFFPLICIVLSCSLLYLVLKSNNKFRNIILFYTSGIVGIIGLIIVLKEGVILRVIEWIIRF